MKATAEAATLRRPKHRVVQFSLRTLLLAVTALAVLLGLHYQPARQQSRAAEAIRALGGQVAVEPVGPAWLARLVGEERFVRVTAVEFLEVPVGDEALEHLENLTHLESLLLYGPRFTDAGLEHLEQVSNLRQLSFLRTNVTNRGLRHLTGLVNLEETNFSEVPMTDAGLRHLKGLTNLRHISLAQVPITDAGLEHLENLSQLRELHLWRTQVSEAGVARLQGRLPSLKITGR